MYLVRELGEVDRKISGNKTEEKKVLKPNFCEFLENLRRGKTSTIFGMFLEKKRFIDEFTLKIGLFLNNARSDKNFCRLGPLMQSRKGIFQNS